MDGSDAPLILHASAVAFQERGLLIQGQSGRGKSSLALDLIALGGVLIADDRTCVTRQEGTLWLSCPAAIRGQIEARGIGILRAPPAPATRLAAVVDLDQTETERLPPPRQIEILGVSVPVLHAIARGPFPAALRQYLLCGRVA